MRDPKKTVMRISLAASVLMLTGKLSAYWYTGSAAIFSDAAESVVHGFATAFALFSLWVASRPADVNHPYGHGRIAYFSAGFEGLLVLVASITIVVSGVIALIRGRQLFNLELGLAITGFLALINLFLGLALIRVGRRQGEIILVANGRHVLSDMWTSLAAIVGVGLVWLSGLTWLDPVAAILIGLYIMKTGLGLVREAFGGLMDETDPELSQQISDLFQQAVSDGRISGFHQLRCRRINRDIWVDVHVLVPGELPTFDSHARTSRVETEVAGAFKDQRVHITTHVEPDDHERAHPGGHKDRPDPLAGLSE